VPHAFHKNDALMCGLLHARFCDGVQGDARQEPKPTLEEVRKGLDGNICRCGTYIASSRRPSTRPKR